MEKTAFYLLFSILFVLSDLSSAGDFKVLHQVTGPGETNCYLLYDVESREAAVIDPGWTIDSLINYIYQNNLILKYIFITHGHIDHFFYVPEVKALFPEAKLVMNKDDYDSIFTVLKWIEENYGKGWIDEAKSKPDTKAYIDFDMNSLGEPDIYVEDNQTLWLGTLKIKTIHSPGHSCGSICYQTGDVLFSGDVLFYRLVGRIDTQGGSKEDQIKSVRRLYELLPDSTIVYPGHGKFTDIGSEKKENKRITLDSIKYKR
jgi:hydroxyacylglutathione hydrolase